MKLSVLYTCNELYAHFAGVSIHSLLYSNRDAETIDIYLVVDQVSEETLSKLHEEVSRFGPTRRLLVVDGEPYILQMQAGMIPTYRGFYTANLRLFFETYIAPDCERLLYLDCDTVVVGSLQELFSLDMGACAAAVVRESIAGSYPSHIGFSENDAYFNSGVIYVNVPNWKAGKYTEKLFGMMNDPGHCYVNPDQDLLNILLKGQLVWLSPRYNLQPSHLVYSDRAYFHCFPGKNYYTGAEIEDARKRPVILHTYRFCGQFPWHRRSVHPAAAVWKKNLAESVFAGTAPIPNTGMLFAVERMLYHVLPKGFFLRVFKTVQKWAFRRKSERLQKEWRAGKGGLCQTSSKSS